MRNNYNSLILGRLNDIWSFSLSDRRWTWLAGNNTIDIGGSYGIRGVSGSSFPGAREDEVSIFDPKTNQLLSFGGLAPTGTSNLE
jgi:hypothetical protein